MKSESGHELPARTGGGEDRSSLGTETDLRRVVLDAAISVTYLPSTNESDRAMPKQMTPKLLREYSDQSSAYDRFPPEDRLHIVCPQCGTPVLIFEELSRDTRAEIATLSRQDPTAAIELLQRVSGCNPRQAKANVLHIRAQDSSCRNCHSSVRTGALLCAHCMSVNLDW